MKAAKPILSERLLTKYTTLASALAKNGALAALQAEEFSKAAELAGAALELGDDAKARYRRGLAFEKLGEAGKAAEDYAEAMRLAPKDAQVRAAVVRLTPRVG